MVDPNTRSGKRTPVTLKIKFKSETLEQFIERYAVDVSQGGIFIRTKEPLAVGTQMKFEFQLKDASPLIAGEGTVVWTRENDPSRPAIAPGMGVRFDKLADGSQSVLERILAEKAKQAPQRPMKDSTKPPMFTDTPTRVAPAPMQEALLGEKNAGTGGPRRKRPDSQEEKTPLPSPVPFHSDADEFSEEAFEEATKVRALDELVAQTAMAEGASAKKTPSPDDELAARRNNLFKDESAPVAPTPTPADAKTPTSEGERDSAPGLPSPPEPQRPSPKILDTSPSPREASTTSPPLNAAARTQLGMGAATGSSSSIKNAETIPSGIIPIPDAKKVSASSSANLPAAGKRPSSTPIVLGIILFVAAAGAALWFFVLREPAVDTLVPPPKTNPNMPGPGSAAMTMPGSAGSAVVDNGSVGSAVVDKGSAGSAAVAAVMVDTVIASPTDKVTIEVEGTDQKGPAPLTAKLEKDKAYKIKLSATGYVTTEVDVKGGEAKVSKKLDPKKFVVTITTTPPGATFAFDGVIAKSPFEMKAPPKKAVHVRIVKGGYKPVEVVIDPDKWTDEAAQMTFTQDVTLVVAPVVIQTPHPTPDAGSGSAVVPTGNGSGSETGSAAPPPPPPPPPPAGSDTPTP